MQDTLLPQLQRALGEGVTIERELGGGGMSRVFLATEVAFQRHIVIKVLAAELTGSISAERFKREIQVAARLQHPNVVPLLGTGEAEGVPYYTMPYVEGESLRHRLTRERELPIADGIRLIRELAEALVCAHDQGIVHRDIKPENLLLSGGHLQVTDFGIAKALGVASAAGTNGLTSTGVSIGTLGYMAPEQAVGDPAADHRVDIYALGVVAYEILAGQRLFGDRPPASLMAAHAIEVPRPIAELRPSVPVSLAQLVMSCLAKRPADRPQTARELLEALDSLSLPRVGTDAGSVAIAPSQSGSTLAGYFILVAASILLTWLMQRVVGLPEWVLPAVAGAALIVTPVVSVWQRRRQNTLNASVPSAERARVAWRSGLRAGGLAVGAIGLATALYVGSRLSGVGPAATLLSSGALRESDRLLVTDLDAPPADSTAARALTEALRVDLADSRIVGVTSRADIDRTLEQMQLPVTTRLTGDVARDLASRRGIAAVVSGAITPVGSGYLIGVQLRTASGEELAALTEPVTSADDLVDGIGRVARALRARIGESLKSLGAARPLEAVTTRSLRALELYTRAQDLVRAGRVDQSPETIRLLREAVRADSTFVMAQRRLGIALRNTGRFTEALAALRAAERHTDRASAVERLTTEATLAEVLHDYPASTAAAERVLQLDPDNEWVYGELSRNYNMLGRATEAESMAVRSARRFGNRFGVSNALLFQGRATEVVEWARRDISTLQQGDSVDRRRRQSDLGRAWHSVGALDSADRYLATSGSTINLFRTRAMRGRLGDAWMAIGGRAQVAASDNAAYGAVAEALATNSPIAPAAAAQWARDSSWVSQGPDRSIWPIMALALSGAGDAADTALRALIKTTTPDVRIARRHQLEMASGVVALARRRPTEAIPYFQRGEQYALHGFYDHCKVCSLPWLARAYDAANLPDSAIAVGERFLATPDAFRMAADGAWRANTLRRLGDLYAARGDTAKAVARYGAFLDLWDKADAELQPQVAEVRRATRALGADAARPRSVRP